MRAFARIGVILGVLAALALPSASAPAAPAEWTLPPDDPQVISQSMKDVQACLSVEGSTLAVFYLIDTSGSMNKTDSQGLRYKAIQASIEPLAKLTDSTSPAPHPVKIAAGTFSSGYSQVLIPNADAQGWVDLSKGNERSVATGLSNAVLKAGTAGSTNWALAIQGAAAALKTQAQSAGGKPNCQMLVWLTDGGIDVSNEIGPDASAQALADLCGVSPTADPQVVPEGSMFQLRDSGVAVLGLLLATGDLTPAGTISRMSYFKPVVQGTGKVDPTFFAPRGKVPSTYDCGANAEGAQGAQLLTRNASQLATTFTEMVNCFVETCTNGLDPVDRNPEWDLWMPKGLSKVVITAPRNSVLKVGSETWCQP